MGNIRDLGEPGNTDDSIALTYAGNKQNTCDTLYEHQWPCG